MTPAPASSSGKQTRRSLRPVVRWSVVVLGLALLTALVWWANSGSTDDPIGSEDFIAYWSAFEVAAGGDDPYDPGSLSVVQDEIELEALTETQRFWNPPWLLVLLAPVLALPFDVAVALWFALGLAAMAGAALLGWRLFGPSDRPLPPLALAGAVFFIPTLESLRLGQMSAALAVVVLSGLFALRGQRDLLAGILFGLVATKPQTMLLVLIVIGVHVIWTRRWAVVAGAVATVLALATASWVFFPTAVRAWNPVSGAPTHWRTATLAGWLRVGLERAGDAPTWPLVAVPLVALMATVPWAFKWRRAARWHVLPALLIMSFLIAPYGWIFDLAVLGVIQAVVLGYLLLGERRAAPLVGGFVVLQIAGLWWRSLPWTEQQHMVVFALAMLVLEVWRQQTALVPPPGEARSESLETSLQPYMEPWPTTSGTTCTGRAADGVTG